MRAHVRIALGFIFVASQGCGSKLTNNDAGTGPTDTGGAGGFAMAGTFGTGGPATGGNVGTGGIAGVHDASVDAVGGLACAALSAAHETTPPRPPAAGCPCTRTPGRGNSYLCPMGIGQTAYAYIGPEGGQISILGQQGTPSNVPFGIKIPAGALSSTTFVSVTETNLPPPSGVLDWSPVYLVEPRGLQLARVAALQIPWSSNSTLIPKTLAIYARDENGSCEFTPLVDSYTNAGFEQASLTRFGYLLVGVPSTIDPATCTGADASPGDGARATDGAPTRDDAARD